MMRRRPLILVGVLLVLFIVPMSFGNVAATEYEYSPESVTSFSETLPDDVLFYPDSFFDGISHVAYAGEGDWIASTTNTGITVNDAWIVSNTTGTVSEEIYFLFPNGIVESFSYSCYSYAYEGTGSLDYYNGSDWVVLDSFTTSYPPTWKNGTHVISSLGNPAILELRQTCSGAMFPESRIFYLEIEWSYMTSVYGVGPRLSNPLFATGGDTGFGNTYTVDASNFSVDGILEFSYDASNISSLVSFTYAIYGVSAGTTFVHYSSDDVDYGSGPFDVITSEGWYNGTYNTVLGALENTGTGYVQFFSNHESSINYMEISFTYILVSAYGESFSDVSDWSVISGSALSTDGDVMTITHIGDSGWDTYECDVPSLTGTNYVEVRLKWGTDAGSNNVLVSVDEEDDWSGATSEPLGYLSTIPDSYTTYKVIIEQDVESIRFAVQSTAADTLLIDYLRIGPSNEMGWQHDGSTTEGTTTNGLTSTDGDILTFEADTNIDWMYVHADETSTSANIELGYYQFIEFSITSATATYRVDAIGTLASSTIKAYSTDTGTFRFNLASIESTIGEFDYLRVYISVSGTNILFDYIKFYSIADYTVFEIGDESINDVLYVESGSVIVSYLVGVFKMGNDLELSVLSATYTNWNATVSNGASDFRFRELQDVSVYHDQGATNGTLQSTTLEDYEIVFYGPCTLSAIKFYGIVPSWNIITTVEIVFWVAGWQIISSIIIVFATEISTYAINLLFLFLGLAMIPTSTILLVKGGRSEMSTDKLLVVILCFFMGWALFLGGIFA